MSLRVLVLAVVVGVPCVGQTAPTELHFSIDLRGRAEAGVVSATGLGRLTLLGVDELLVAWERGRAEAAGVAIRTAALVLVDAAVISYATMLPHEVLGHGARAREMGLGAWYDFSAPLPYALLARRGFHNETRWDGEGLPPASDDDARFVLGGYDAEELQLREIAWSAFRSRTLSRGDALLYGLGRPLVIRFLVGGGDPVSHRRHLAARYRADPDRQQAATALSLGLTLLDPLLLASLRAAVVYLAHGEREFAVPVLHAGPIDLSFTNRLWLVPWGREHRLGLFAGASYASAELALRIGEGPAGGSMGIGLEVADIAVCSLLRLSAGIEVLEQPALVLASEQTGVGRLGAPPGRRSGFAGSAGLEIRTGHVATGVRVAAKSPGHLPGRPYGADWSIQLTLAVPAG